MNSKDLFKLALEKFIADPLNNPLSRSETMDAAKLALLYIQKKEAE